MNLCLTARVRKHPQPRNFKKLPSQRPLTAFDLRPGGRFVDAPYETLQPQCQSPPLFFREEAPQLTLTAVRLDHEPARVQACCGAAQFNLRPMPREHNLLQAVAPARFDAHLALAHGDALAVVAPLQ